MRSLLMALLLLATATAARAARVDTLAIPSATMPNTYRAAAGLPASHANNKKAHYPAVPYTHLLPHEP